MEQSKLDLSSNVGRVPQAVGRAVRPAVKKQEHESLVFQPFFSPGPERGLCLARRRPTARSRRAGGVGPRLRACPDQVP